ncbi:hypothetical protein ACFZCL_19030 [Streptomyces sp. NPDC008159]|uniref:hypothetical protein n=1 Tax=Streptomyces sp. NPDC008159 TaxID=3364817 RepID=UPI0036E9720D
MTLKPWAWAGIGVCGAGVATLVGFAFVDLGTADQIASVAGGSVGLFGFVLAVVAQFGGSSAPPAPPTAPAGHTQVTASGSGAIAAGGSIGAASTGGAPLPAPASPAPAPAPAPPAGGVTASGTGSIAAGGDIGTASTGT